MRNMFMEGMLQAGEDAQLRAGDAPRQDERVLEVDELVLVAGQDQGWVLDLRQTAIRVVQGDRLRLVTQPVGRRREADQRKDEVLEMRVRFCERVVCPEALEELGEPGRARDFAAGLLLELLDV